MEEKYRVHAFYILLILCSIIVGLISVKWSTIPDLPGLITFALTITSLVLALLAIVYAYVSNFSFQQTTLTLSRAAEDVQKSAAKVRSATVQLGEQVQAIPSLLTTVGERVEQTHALLVEYSGKQITDISIAEASSTLTTDFVTRFVEATSVSGLFALLGMKSSLEKKKPINLDALAEAAGLVGNGLYFNGFLVASYAAGVVDYSSSAGSLQCDHLNESVSSQLEDRLLSSIHTLSATPEFRTELFAGLDRIKGLFETSSSTAPASSASGATPSPKSPAPQ